MAIRCGRGRHFHATIEEMRRCLNGETAREQGSVSVLDRPDDEPRATEKQINFLSSLATQKLEKTEAERIIALANEGHWSRHSISPEINRLKKLPRRPRETATETTEDGQKDAPPQFDPQTLVEGFYVHESHPYKVIVAKNGSGRKYAKRLSLETGKWEYDRGGIGKLRPEEQMTLEQALEIAKMASGDVNAVLYGHCFICGLSLTDDDSIARMIGPICWAKLGGS